jgi:3-dehydroquinate dehydratase II
MNHEVIAGRVFVLNGPNLGRLGSREPEIYGHASYADLVSLCEREGAALSLSVDVRQTEDEAELIRWIHEAIDTAADIVINPAAFTHYSYALRDALAQCTGTVIEVHLSNPASREEFRHESVVSGVVTGTIAGFGVNSYVLALQAISRFRTSG